jgi:hypothetical protein
VFRPAHWQDCALAPRRRAQKPLPRPSPRDWRARRAPQSPPGLYVELRVAASSGIAAAHDAAAPYRLDRPGYPVGVPRGSGIRHFRHGALHDGGTNATPGQCATAASPRPNRNLGTAFPFPDPCQKGEHLLRPTAGRDTSVADPARERGKEVQDDNTDDGSGCPRIGSRRTDVAAPQAGRGAPFAAARTWRRSRARSASRPLR